MTPAGLRRVLRALAGLCHLTLLAATATWSLRSGQGWSVILLAGGVAPLLLALGGLYRDNARTYQWLSLVLILYAGIGSVEVIASQRTATSAVVMMMTALAELFLLMSLIRNAPPEPRRENLE